MKRFLYLIILCALCSTVQAQHVFQGTSLSEALIALDKSTKRYDISFVYDELEDFTVTKTVKRGRSLPEAVREVCGFYPVRVSVKGHDILVECIQKDRTKLMGRLVGPDRQPVAYANIVLYDDTLVIGGGVSNEAGDFVIPCGMSQADVRISCVGFKTIERQMPVADVGTIRMQMDNKLLNNVTVSGRMPVIRSEANRLLYIVNNDEYAQGMTAFELLNRVPMVGMVNGRATILGKGTAHYMMNGRVMEMDDEVIHQRLWSIRAEDIERIEVITMPTGKYLSDLGGGYINFVMNRDQSLGWRSDLSVQAGTSDKWSGRTDASVNYASEQFDMALDVNGNWLTKTEDKDVAYSFPTEERTVASHKETEDKDLGASLMLRYLPHKKLEIGALASYQYLWPKSDISSENHLKSDLNEDGDAYYSYVPPAEYYNDIASESSLKYKGNHVLNLSTYVDWTLGKPDSKLSFSYNFYQKQDDNTSKVCSNPINSFVCQTSIKNNESSYRIHSARLDLSTPLSTATTFNAGVSYTNIKNEAKNLFDSYNNVYDDLLPLTPSTNYSHEENILAGYLSFQHSFSKQLKAMAGLRYEHTKNTQYYNNYNYSKYISTNDTKDDHFYPTLSFNYHSDHGEQIGAAWTMSVTRPNFHDLNPLTVYESAYDTSQGYPFLKPSYENRVEVSFSSHRGFYANLYYTHGKDQIDWKTFYSIMYSSTTPDNLYKSDKTGLYVNYNHRFSQWMNIIADGELFYYDAETYHDNVDNGMTSLYFWVVNSGLHGWGKRFAVSGDIFLNRLHSMILNIRYDQWLDDYVGVTKIDAYGYFTFALRYSLLNDRLKLSLTAVDPFHQQIIDKTRNCSLGPFQKVHTNLHSHYIGLTATYSLGGKKIRQIHHDFKDSEQQRAEKQ